MKKYILTSHHFEGSVEFTFDTNGWLIFFHNDARFDDTQHAWLLNEKRFPKRIEQIEALAHVVKGTLKELPPDLSFPIFWNAYDKKINKHRAEPLYNKLKDADKLKAILAIKPYQDYCGRSNRGIADAESICVMPITKPTGTNSDEPYFKETNQPGKNDFNQAKSG